MNSKEREAKVDEDTTLKKCTIIQMKHYHIKHFYFLNKNTEPV